MNEFLEKWKNDKKYRTKIKLLAYIAFLVIVSIYALSINNSRLESNSGYESKEHNESKNNEEDIIKIPTEYSYNINITIDEEVYSYHGQKGLNEETITKEAPEGITNYVLIDNAYQITTKEEVYDIVNYNYLNLTNINKYLSKATKNNNQYFVYLKDVILGSESKDYFIITVNDNHIIIDYTKLFKEFNSNINKYLVDITLEFKEWKRWNNAKKE